jgi:hypothetical protein
MNRPGNFHGQRPIANRVPQNMLRSAVIALTFVTAVYVLANVIYIDSHPSDRSLTAAADPPNA